MRDDAYSLSFHFDAEFIAVRYDWERFSIEHEQREKLDMRVRLNVERPDQLEGVGMDRLKGNRVRWQGIAGYGRVSPAAKLRISPRIEWYDWSDRAVFERDNRRPISHHSTLTVGVVFTYSKTR